jgi:hypothetical protein
MAVILARTFWDHYEAGVWEGCRDGEEVEEEFREEGEEVPQRLLIGNPSSMLLHYLDRSRLNHYHLDHLDHPGLDSGSDQEPMLRNRHQQLTFPLPHFLSHGRFPTKYGKREPKSDQGRRVSGPKQTQRRSCLHWVA